MDNCMEGEWQRGKDKCSALWKILELAEPVVRAMVQGHHDSMIVSFIL